MPTFNMTSVVEANTILDLIVGVDTAAEGQIGFRPIGMLLIMAVFVIILFRSVRTNPVPESVFVAGIVAVFTSLLMSWLGWVNLVVLIITSIITFLALVAMYKSNST